MQSSIIDPEILYPELGALLKGTKQLWRFINSLYNRSAPYRTKIQTCLQDRSSDIVKKPLLFTLRNDLQHF